MIKLFKLSYSEETGIEMLNASKKIEFFFHYWQDIFTKKRLRHDPYWMKSHRSLLERLKIQIEGNYEQSYRHVKKYFVNEEYFDFNDPIISKISSDSFNSNLSTLKVKLNSSFNKPQIKDLTNPTLSIANPNYFSQQDVLKCIRKLELFLDKKYHDIVYDELIDVLSNDTSASNDDLKRISILTNCLVENLLELGFPKKYLSEYVENLFDEEHYPYEQNIGDFDSKADYEKYKNEFFSGLNIKIQLKSIFDLLKTKDKDYLVIYSIQNLNWQIAPVNILGVDFYNPNIDKKIIPQTNVKFKMFEENFTLSDSESNSVSTCNAYIKISATHQQLALKKSFSHVENALQVLNSEFDKNGVLNKQSVLFSHPVKQVLLGNTQALINSRQMVTRMTNWVEDDINYINQLDAKDEQDNKVIDFITSISKAELSNNTDSLLNLWRSLEAFVGTKSKIQEFYLSCIKIALNQGLLEATILHLNNAFSEMKTSKLRIHTMNAERMAHYGLGVTINGLTPVKFRNKISTLKNETEILFVQNECEDILRYINNKPSYHDEFKEYINYLITEFYIERNLNVHSKVSEPYIQNKRDEIFSLTKDVIRVFLKKHLHYNKRKTASFIIEKIKQEAATV